MHTRLECACIISCSPFTALMHCTLSPLLQTDSLLPFLFAQFFQGCWTAWQSAVIKDLAPVDPMPSIIAPLTAGPAFKQQSSGTASSGDTSFTDRGSDSSIANMSISSSTLEVPSVHDATKVRWAPGLGFQKRSRLSIQMCFTHKQCDPEVSKYFGLNFSFADWPKCLRNMG